MDNYKKGWKMAEFDSDDEVLQLAIAREEDANQFLCLSRASTMQGMKKLNMSGIGY